MDPMTVLTIIGTGLGLVDKFYDLAKKIKGEVTGPHSVQILPVQDKLLIQDHGHTQEITANELRLGEYDQVRHDTLWQRVKINWQRYNGLDVQRALAAADEKVRLEVQMDQLRGDLCPDFRELVRMYEKILNRGLPDHYSLYDVCR